MEMNRRDFNKMVLSVVGGLMAGASVGCGKSEAPKKDPESAKKPEAAVAEKHVCKGFNSCKGKGQGGKNECKGKGDCATVAKHDCKGHNDCKGLGGCKSGNNGCAGKNDCKKKGGCGVPLSDSMREALKSGKKK